MKTDVLIIRSEPAPHIRYSDIKAHLSEEDLASLNAWMDGQTQLYLGEDDSGIYPWDYDRWLNRNNGQTRPSAEDWD